MASDPITLKGVVLPASDFKDKDKLIPFLTGEMGLIRVCAKGALKQGNKLCALTAPFSICEITFTESNGFYYVKDFVIVESNSGISVSLEALAVALHIYECVKVCSFDYDNTQKIYQLCVYALYSLNINTDYKLVYSAFNWKLLDILGMTVFYEVCSKCQQKISEDNAYLIELSQGIVLCGECSLKTRTSGDFVSLTGSLIALLNYFKKSEFSRLFAVNAREDALDALCSFTEDYLSLAFETDLKSMQKYNKSLNMFSIPNDRGKE